MIANFGAFRTILQHITLDWTKLAYINLMGVVQVVFQLAIPYGSLLIINEAIPNKDVKQLVIVSLVLTLAVLLSNVLSLIALRKTVELKESLKLALQRSVLYKIECLPISLHNNENKGTFAQIILSESSSVIEFICNFTEAGKTLLWVLVAIYVIPQVSLAVGLFVLASLPLYLLLLKVFNSKIEEQFSHVQDYSFKQSSVVYSTLAAMKEVKSYQLEKTQAEQFSTATAKRKLHLVSGQMLMAIGNNLSEAVITASTLFILLYGGYGVINETISLGEVIALNTIVLYLYAPFNAIVDVYFDFNAIKCSAQKLTAILSEPDDCYGNELLVTPVKGEVVFENIHFSREQRAILNAVSFTLKPGEKCLLVGEVGQGKSTLLNLLFRLIEPDSGQIKLDGKDISTLEVSQIRQNIAVVHQDCHLFSDTILSNILVGKPSATTEEVKQACETTGLSQVVDQLPDSWDTMVGENGCKLSGGQRQLIAITRALLKDAPILLLDEATSSLDNAKEAHIIDLLKTLAKDKTTIVVSHKYESVLDKVDKHFQLVDGQLIDRTPA
ncbi:ABC transporter ATP-binding protein [Shewanella sp.]|uniref:ABC transporter ATP-binding protein n=1 Tax=Shewanella sp. TaxID=50422 RepID=UPI003569BBB7